MSILQLVHGVVEPSTALIPNESPAVQFQTMKAIIWEQIWSISNKVMFQQVEVKINVMLAVIDKKFREHIAISDQQKTGK